MDLQPIQVEGIEIDTCGGCGGVFLDHGELDAMLSRDKKEGIFSKVLRVFE
jgi:Zn-finger nucleic acid-binding protein